MTLAQTDPRPLLEPSDNLYEYLLANARPDAPAVFYREEVLTYKDLLDLACGSAATLQANGVRKGDRVGILAENSPFWIGSYLGILKIGAVATPLPSRLTPERLAELIDLLDCRAFCIDALRLLKASAVIPPGAFVLTNKLPRTNPNSPLPFRVELRVSGTDCPTAPINPRDDLAALMFTSGSTGKPNAVKVSHRNIQANTQSIIDYLKLTEADRMLVVLPFDYCFGTSLLHTHLRVGGSLVLENSFQFMEDVLNRLEQRECTGFAGVPMTYQHLLRRSSFSHRRFPKLRYVQQAGGRLPNAFIQEFLNAHPDTKYYLMYGQTEATARLSYLPPERLSDKFGSIGRGIPGVTLHLLNTNGQPVPPGEIGEIVAEGENITLGYWLPDPAKNPFRDGKLYTGDLAKLDEDGFIFIMDRASDFIKPNGHRVSSREIEEVLAEIPDVIEAAVIGVPDEEVGEAAKAFVVPKAESGLTEQQIMERCRGKLPAYAIPRQIVFLAELPKNDAQKVIKHRLKTM